MKSSHSNTQLLISSTNEIIDATILQFFIAKGFKRALEQDLDAIAKLGAVELSEAGIDYKYAERKLEYLWKELHVYTDDGYASDDIEF